MLSYEIYFTLYLMQTIVRATTNEFCNVRTSRNEHLVDVSRGRMGSLEGAARHPPEGT